MSRKIRKFRTDEFDTVRKQTETLTHATHANGWSAVYMSCMSQNFRLLHVSNLAVRNFRFFSAHVSGVGVGVLYVRTRPADTRSAAGAVDLSGHSPGLWHI